MFYDTRTGDHGLPHDPFKACVVPRPIGWITSMTEAGSVNLAPYSFFNGLAGDPPCVMFPPGGRQPDAPPDGSKDSPAHVERTVRSAERRVGKVCVSPVRSRRSPSHQKHNI